MKKVGKGLAVAIAFATLTTGLLAGCGEKDTPESGAITLDKETLSLDADRSEKLSATGADEIVWSSENEAVAKVDQNGNVTGVNPGTCKITAATKDGSYETECVVTVTGYHLSSNVFAGFTKVENNTYNGEINYAIDNSDEDAFIVSYDRSVMTNSWTSLVLWYDCELSPTSFELEFEVTEGSLPCLMFEFGGESSFKQYERYVVQEGKNTVSLNTTDLDLDGEGSWKAIYLELNNPCPLDGTTDEVKGATSIKFTSIQLKEGVKTAPAAPENAEGKDGMIYWDRVLAASEYELTVDGVEITDLMNRSRANGDAPVMRRVYKPTDENAFTVGEHTAKIRSKNSAGTSEWKEFTFTVEASGDENAEGIFRNITSQGNNQWNATENFYTAAVQEDGSVNISFTGASADMWDTYLFNFDTSTIEATKLHIKVRLISGELEQVRYQVDGANGTVYGEDLVFDADGYAELTADVTTDGLASSYGNVMLFLNKYATEGAQYVVQVIDVSLYTPGAAAAFRGITSQGNNQWNATENFYTAAVQEDGSVNISFTGASADMWDTYLFNFDTSTIEATKLHIKVRLISGELEQVRYQVDGANGTVYGEDLVFDADGYAELTADVTTDGLASSYGNVMLFLNKYATEGAQYVVQVIDVSLS